ncbi:MAG: hypothetical protein ACU0AU_13760 [Cognatishimia activa]
MRIFAATLALLCSIQPVQALEVNLQGVQHLQTVNVVYSGLEKGREYFFTCYGHSADDEIVATAGGYATGPVYSEELYFNTAESASSIVRVECVES